MSAITMYRVEAQKQCISWSYSQRPLRLGRDRVAGDAGGESVWPPNTAAAMASKVSSDEQNAEGHSTKDFYFLNWSNSCRVALDDQSQVYLTKIQKYPYPSTVLVVGFFHTCHGQAVPATPIFGALWPSRLISCDQKDESVHPAMLGKLTPEESGWQGSHPAQGQPISSTVGNIHKFD